MTTDKELLDKCTEYVNFFLEEVKLKLSENQFTYYSEEKNDFICFAYLDCKKHLEKVKESMMNKGISNPKLDEIIIKEIVRRTMFYKYIKQEEAMLV